VILRKIAGTVVLVSGVQIGVNGIAKGVTNASTVCLSLVKSVLLKNMHIGRKVLAIGDVGTKDPMFCQII
jgi:hypothetical protein